MILKRSGTTLKFLRENPAFSFAVKKPAERGVSSAYLSRTRQLSVLAGEFNLTALSGLCGAARSIGGTCRTVQAKIPLVKNPRERNSRLNKADKTNNVFFARDIKVLKVSFTLPLSGAISSGTPPKRDHVFFSR